MHVTFIRHMETDWNREGRYTGQAIHPRLNATGNAQAQEMAKRLKDFHFDAIYCSDQLRAIETALIIGESHPEVRAIVTDNRLREVNVGPFVGKEISQIADSRFLTKNPQFDFRPVGGECPEDAIVRQVPILAHIYLCRQIRECLIVGHGTSLRLLLKFLDINEPLTRENFLRVNLKSTLESKMFEGTFRANFNSMTH